MCDTFSFVGLSHDIFTDDILFSMLQNYLDIFLFCDRFLRCMVTSIIKQNMAAVKRGAPLSVGNSTKESILELDLGITTATAAPTAAAGLPAAREQVVDLLVVRHLGVAVPSSGCCARSSAPS
jgi:hypothetical protein